ncbi:MAG: 50S ribosomal protein L17 [Puniceicoccales bacterium]|jgi:large subunit ribosomal protein L17|nr:50S ribosomal protein L17 [Puniceicoccales bacterium]
MRHGKHRYSLGRVKEHREALMANLAAALFRHGRIETTLAKAKALRPFAEKLITMAKKAHLSEDSAQKLHYRRLVIARIGDEDAAAILFNDRAAEFAKRNGGYSRIYKLDQRVGDAAKMAIVELIAGDDAGYSKSRKRKSAKAKKSGSAKVKEVAKKAPDASPVEATPLAIVDVGVPVPGAATQE